MAYINNKIALILMAFLMAVSSLAVAEIQVSRLMLVQNEQTTRAYIDLSGQATFKAFPLQGPDRAVLDVEGAVPAEGFKLPAANGLVLSVRQGKTANGMRLVFDLASAAEMSSRLETQGGQNRLVLELGKGSAAPADGPEQTQAETVQAITPNTAPTVPVIAKPVPPPVPVVPLPVPVSSQAPADDGIARIDIDSSGTAPKTTVIPATGNADVPSSGGKAAKKPTASVPLAPKKGKTMDDVLGPSARKMVIAIDAGHGGKDPGAIGPSGLREKDVTLRVARELADAINAEPGMRAVLIRDNDQFVALQDRYMRARRAQADLFVSIHADAAENNAASGSSVYVLSTKGASSQAARWLADKENAADLVGGVSLDNKEGFLSAVLLDLSQSATMRMSEDAAGSVLQSLKDLGKAHKKQVEHANFVVLRSPDVPSMLVETGFITNAEEERKLNDPQHRKRLAFAITQGIRSYFVGQPLPGTYYARRQNAPPPGVNAVSGPILPE